MKPFNIPDVSTASMPLWELQSPALAYRLAQALTHQPERQMEAIRAHELALMLDPRRIQSANYLCMLWDTQVGGGPQARAARAKWWEMFGAPCYAKRQPHTNDPTPDRPLRIGYVSSDFKAHSATQVWSAAVLGNFPDMTSVCYSNATPMTQNKVTQVFRDRCEFHDVWMLNAEEFAEKIRRDRIDILVDLNGYTVGNRLTTFAYKPAPVQVEAWGYVISLGWPEPAMDVLFADEFVVQGCEITEPTIIGLPSVISLIGGGVTWYPDPAPRRPGPPRLGALHAIRKLNPHDLTLWAKVLAQMPDATLTFGGHGYSDSNVKWVVSFFPGMEHRLIFRGELPHKAHLESVASLDIMLDSFPQTGGVSTIEAAMCGVPTMTLVTNEMVQRASGSIMRTCGLPGMVCTTELDYIGRTVALLTRDAGQIELKFIREHLRATIEKSPICTGYLSAIQNAFRLVWQHWCAAERGEIVEAVSA